MDVQIRPIEPSEVPAFIRTDAAGFGESTEWAEHAKRWVAEELERTACAFDGDQLVATSRNYSFELTVPGAAQLPAAGLSAVAVLPTHRRRGILRQMMQRLLDDAVERREPVAMLTASEGGIYGRFGFGVTTRSQGIELDTRDAAFAPARPDGRLRLVDVEEARKLEPEVYDRVRLAYPGALSRCDAWWSDVQYEHHFGTRFDVVYEARSGSLDGFVVYAVKDKWEPDGGAAHLVKVRDFVAATPEAAHALWRFLCEIDLVRTVRSSTVPLDSPLPWLLVSPRALRVSRVGDNVWHRILDVPASLAARRYAIDGQLALVVHDPFRPSGAAHGSFVLEGGPDGATVRTGAGTVDLECDVAALSAAWLGGVRWSELAAAGRVRAHRPAALARADQMFASTPLPYPFTWF